jgi:hypothetical protein
MSERYEQGDGCPECGGMLAWEEDADYLGCNLQCLDCGHVVRGRTGLNLARPGEPETQSGVRATAETVADPARRSTPADLVDAWERRGIRPVPADDRETGAAKRAAERRE